MTRRWGITIAGTATLAMVLAGCGSSGGNSAGGNNSAKGGTVTVGVSTSLSGSIAYLGQTSLNGVQMAVDDINAKGGLLGKKIKVVSADDNITPATGASNVRSMITSDHAVALFGRRPSGRL